MSSIRFDRFLLALGVAGLIRAAAYSFLGSTLFDIGSPGFYVATVTLTGAVFLPLLNTGVRQKVLAGWSGESLDQERKG